MDTMLFLYLVIGLSVVMMFSSSTVAASRRLKLDIEC